MGETQPLQKARAGRSAVNIRQKAFSFALLAQVEGVLLLRPPGVYEPQNDTSVLAQALGRTPLPPGARVLEVCTGTGVLAIAAARAGAAEVTAVDISRRAVWAARLNARFRRLPVRVLHGDLFGPVTGRRFDVVLVNPPYVAGRAERPGPHDRARSWDGGLNGRRLVDRICAEVPAVLAPGGWLLMVHSGLCDAQGTLDRLQAGGMKAHVIGRWWEPFGPVMRRRAVALEEAGLILPGQRVEELVVIRAQRP